MQQLYQRAEDGFPVGADEVMKDAYGPIPAAKRFQHHRGYGYFKPAQIHGWQWSTTFNRWGAMVTFEDGWKGLTWPEPEELALAEGQPVIRMVNGIEGGETFCYADDEERRQGLARLLHRAISLDDGIERQFIFELHDDEGESLDSSDLVATFDGKTVVLHDIELEGFAPAQEVLEGV